MFKAMKSASMQQEADFVKAGNPGLFQSTPKVTCEDWDCIQRLDVRTLLCTNVVQGSSCEWETAVEAICSSDVCRNVGDLFQNLKRVKRSVCRTSHATVLLFPRQRLIREAGIGMTDEGLITFCGKRAVEFERYFINGEYDDRSIEDALKLYGSFYILEALQEKWSDAHMFKCNCPCCFQYAGCHHVVLATMVCDPSLVCPTKYLLSEIQARRKRGRPGARKGDKSDGESELESRERVDGPSTSMEEVSPLFHAYNVHVPEWSALQGRFSMETVESEDDEFAPDLSQRTASQKQASQQVCKEYCCCWDGCV